MIEPGTKYRKVKVTENNGTVTDMNISHYEMKNGYWYFYTDLGTNRCPISDVIDIKECGPVIGVVSQAAGLIVGTATVKCTKKIFSDAMLNACPSQNPFVKGCWKATGYIGSVGLGIAVDSLVTNAVQEKMLPVVDILKWECSFVKGLFNAVNDVKEEQKNGSNMKEVFEEGPENA